MNSYILDNVYIFVCDVYEKMDVNWDGPEFIGKLSFRKDPKVAEREVMQVGSNVSNKL